MLSTLFSSAARGVAKRTGAAAKPALFSTASIDPSKMDITKAQTRKLFPPKEELLFGQLFTDHMLEIDWTSDHGWHAPVIRPYGPFQMDPAASVLHYGLECFEGMKGYLDSEGRTRLFRPDMNMARMKVSCERMNLPDFDGDAFLECIKELVRLDKGCIPEGDGFSLYLRPTAISTPPVLGRHRSPVVEAVLHIESRRTVLPGRLQAGHAVCRQPEPPGMAWGGWVYQVWGQLRADHQGPNGRCEKGLLASFVALWGR